MTLLAARDIRKAFAGVHALRGLSFDVRGGDVHALVGENGAGKSTFVRILTGAETADSGWLEIAGERVAALTPAASRSLGIAAIYQQPALFPDLTVAENIALATERARPWTKVDWRARRARAVSLLGSTGASIDPDRLVETLSLPEQQLVEIAKAIGADAKVVVMDEPTASLTEREVDRLFAVVRRLRESGAGVLYISHRLEEIRRIADRITVIRDGETVAASLAPDTDTGQIVRLMVGRTLADMPARGRHDVHEVVLDVRNLSSRAAGVADVSVTVRRGEILGIAGLVGSGRTELAETLFGLRAADDGEVWLEGKRVAFQSPSDAIRARVAYVPEDRRRHGVLIDMTVAENTSLACLDRVSQAGFIRPRAEIRLAETFIERFAIKTSSALSSVGMLSGGNQQKVALSRWLATDPVLLILDEPTQGVDVGSKAEIHTLIRQLADDGLAVVLISSELPEILALSDRIAVMRSGRVAATVLCEGATEAGILSLALGHS